MNTTTVTITGQAGKSMTLPKSVFEVKAPATLLAQAVRVYLGNQRKAAARTKTRSDVNKTTAKMFRQKGTGNARHGSYSAPIFVGGGVAFGPDGRQNFTRVLPKAMAEKALAGALSLRAAGKKLWVLENAQAVSGKAKEAQAFLKKSTSETHSILVVVAPKQAAVTKAFRNLANAEVVETSRLHPYHVMAHQGVVLTTEAVEQLDTRFTTKN